MRRKDEKKRKEEEWSETPTIGLKMNSFSGVQLSYAQDLTKNFNLKLLGRLRLYETRPSMFDDFGIAIKIRL